MKKHFWIAVLIGLGFLIWSLGLWQLISMLQADPILFFIGFVLAGVFIVVAYVCAKVT